VSSNFAECWYHTNFKWPYFHTAGGYGHKVGESGSPVCIVHIDVSLTWSKVKVKVTDLKFRKLHCSTSTSSAMHRDHNWRVNTILWDLVYSFSEPDFLISSPVGGHVTSKFAKCWYHQKSLCFISALTDARNLWLRLHVGRNEPCMLAAMTVSQLARLSCWFFCWCRDGRRRRKSVQKGITKQQKSERERKYPAAGPHKSGTGNTEP